MKTVIVGSGPAGSYTALKLKAALPQEAIYLIDAEGEGLYAKIRLSEYLTGSLARDKLILTSAAQFQAKGIIYKAGVKVKSLEPYNKEILTTAGRIAYDRLILATGARPFIPALEGSAAKEILGLRNLNDADKIKALINQRETGQAIVLGAGLLGLELAYALLQVKWQVQVLEFLPQILPHQLSEAGGAKVQNILQSLGCSFCFGHKACVINKKTTGGYSIQLDNGEIFKADLVIASTGIQPRIDLAQSADLLVHKGILVNNRLESSHEAIYALGDCAELPSGQIPGLWMAAMHQADGLVAILRGERQSYDSPVYSPLLKIPGVNLA